MNSPLELWVALQGATWTAKGAMLTMLALAVVMAWGALVTE